MFVTGTFDDWGKTVQLEKKGDVFEKEVHLPAIAEKIQYKVRRLRRHFRPCLLHDRLCERLAVGVSHDANVSEGQPRTSHM